MAHYKKHGFLTGGKRPRYYVIWQDMKARCKNPNLKSYKYVGAKGLSYDKKWETFEGFWEDMEEGYSDKLTLDRIDNNKGYFKSNCRWTTPQKQASNTSRNKYFVFDGVKLTHSEISRKLGFKRDTIYNRLRLGWSIEKSISEPLGCCQNK